MSKRLEILKSSLAKKEVLFDERLRQHFETIKQANGQPLNDKRNGIATLNRWDKQNDSIRNIKSSIQRTKDAIEREEAKIALAESVIIPNYMQIAINNGLITQWREHPCFFFVNGVSHGRIVLNEKDGTISHRYVSKISKDEYQKFRDVFNALNKQCREYQEARSNGE